MPNEVVIFEGECDLTDDIAPEYGLADMPIDDERTKRFRASLEKQPPMTEQEIEQMFADLLRQFDETCEEIAINYGPNAAVEYWEKVIERAARWVQRSREQAGKDKPHV